MTLYYLALVSAVLICGSFVWGYWLGQREERRRFLREDRQKRLTLMLWSNAIYGKFAGPLVDMDRRSRYPRREVLPRTMDES